VGSAFLPAALLRPASDRRLVEQLRVGSDAAFEVLFDRHYPSVLRFCRRILRSAEEAEDAAQQTFLAAYCELPRLKEPLALRAWLYTVARHRCLTTLRTRRPQPLEDAREPARDQLLGEVLTRDELRALLADVACLPEDQRAALVLTQLGDLPHAEIAFTLGCSPAKVKALVFQARTALAHGREARNTSCAEFREQIAAARGAAMRRPVLRRHLNVCEGCRAFRDATHADRRSLRGWLPLVTLAWLRRVMLALFSPGGAVGGSALGAASLGGSGLAAAALVTAAIPVAAAVERASQDGERVRGATVAWTPPARERVHRPVAVVGLASPARRAVASPHGGPKVAASPPGARVPAHTHPERGAGGAPARIPGQTPPAADRPHAGPGHGRPATAPPKGAGHGRPATAPPGAAGRGRPATTRPNGSGHGRPATVPPQATGRGRPAGGSTPDDGAASDASHGSGPPAAAAPTAATPSRPDVPSPHVTGGRGRDR
jgi:RNA polymerase sigma factor (sigma-70 family)